MSDGLKSDPRRWGPHPDDLIDGSAVTVTAALVDLIAAQAAGVRTVLTEITVVNPTTTDTVIVLTDGATERRRLPCPAGGGCTINPVLRGTAATAWKINSTVSLAGVYVSASGYRTR